MSFRNKLGEVGNEVLKQVVTYFVAAALTVAAAAIAQRKAHILTSATAIWEMLTAKSIPLWALLAVLVVASFGWLRVYRNRGKMTLHVVWEPQTLHWTIGSVQGKPAMQVSGRALFSHTEPKVNLVLTQAHFDGTSPALGFVPPITVNYGVSAMCAVMCFVEPVKGKKGKPFKGCLVFIDQLNRKHRSPEATFSYVG